MANIHAAQALHMTDQNKYAKYLNAPPSGTTTGDLTKLGLVVPTAISSSANYKYGSAAVTSANAANGQAQLGTGSVDYYVVATAHRKLAGCATPTTTGDLDTWCLDDNKLITNKSGETATSVGKCDTSGTVVDGIGNGC